MDAEFQTETTINAFKDLCKKAYPKGCSKRQKADLMTFFFAGHLTGCVDYVKALKNFPTQEAAVLFMNEIVKDSTCRGLYVANCMLTDKFTDSMFDD